MKPKKETIRHRRDPIKTIDRPKNVAFMLTLTAAKVRFAYKKGDIIEVEGERLKIVSIHSVESNGKTVKVIGKAFPFERVGKTNE